jgi:hypothetical protein
MRVQNGLSIGCDPNQGYTLDVVGGFRSQDGYGQITLSNYFDTGDGRGAVASNSIVNVNSVAGGTMTLNVGGSVLASSVVVSSQVSAAGYYSAQSGVGGVNLGSGATTSIPLKNNGLVTVFAYSSATSPAYVYSASYLVTNYVSNVVWSNSNIMTSGASNFSVVVSNANITISNSSGGSAYLFYNVTFFPIG